MKHFFTLVAVFFIASCGAPSAAWSQDTTPVSNGETGGTGGYAAVKIEGRTLFEIMGARGLSAAERAGKVNRRLSNIIARNEPVRPFDKQDIITRDKETVVTLGGEPIVSVTDADAQDALATRDELALLWGGKMATAVVDARDTRANPLRGASILIRNSFMDLLRSVLQWLPRLAGGIVLLVFFWVFARFNRWVVTSVVTRTQFDTNLRQLLRALAFYGTWTIGVIAILSTLGLEGGSIATTLGISGFVLGFAFKDILSHFFAGLMLLMGRQFQIGDQIVVGEFEGTVERIELRALYLRTYDNRLIVIPNGDVFTSAVTSNTASPLRRSEFVVGIGYDENIEKACAIALEAVKKVEGVAQDPSPDVLVDELASSTVNLKVRFHVSSKRGDYLNVSSECRRQVKLAYDREKISMPTDIQTIVIENMEALVPLLSRNAPNANGAEPKSAASAS
jgi:small conductance mechanosensitive channel